MSSRTHAIGHVVWDWNGTLFDDFHLLVDAANAAFGALGGPVVTPDQYRAGFRRPVRRFYEDVLGRPVSDAEWEQIDSVFHVAYDDLIEHADLAPQARPAITALAAQGVTQSVLSMWHHDRLLPQLARLAIDEHFVRIDGRTGEGGETKAPHLARHVGELVAAGYIVDRGEIVMIGDTLDDAHAAREVGISCVLYAGGEHPVERLRTTGYAVAASLLEALALALGGAPGRR